jgi:protein involved in polysaccharide export with SLBB domain
VETPRGYGPYNGSVLARILVCTLVCAGGCGQSLSSPEQIREFEKAGPITPRVAIDDSDEPETRLGPYEVVPGDLLELQIPPIVRVISSDVEGLIKVGLDKDLRPYSCRVSDAGNITLPIVGEMPVAGKTVGEIESMIVDAYYPKYVVYVPMVVCEVAKYERENERVFTVMGLVNRPNTYPYPPDVHYNLTEAMGFAGGLNMVADPRYVKIYRQNVDGEIVSATFGVGTDSRADAYDIVIKPGDVICVDHTFRTRTNEFFAGLFHVGVGAEARVYR